MVAPAAKKRFDHFRLCDRTRDELWARDGGHPHPAYAGVVEAFGELRPSELTKRQAALARLALETGLHFAPRDDGTAPPPPTGQLDLCPRVLRPEEWRKLEAGLKQRARAVNALVADLHGAQRVLRDKAMPFAAILRDPGFHRELKGVVPPGDRFVTIAAFDLVRLPSGEWLVADHRIGLPAGLGLCLHHRRLLAQAVPELLANQAVEPVASFTARLAEELRARSPRDNPLIVMLARGGGGPSHFEDTFLARHMGIALVRPADLVVREGGVFLRTVEGLARVDVIYRRMESEALDPLAFAQPSASGVPGLTHAVRQGQVAVVNAMGCGVADNRALLRHMDGLLRYYLGEAPLLRTLPTYTCADRDQAEYVAHNVERMRLRLVTDRPGLAQLHPEARTAKHTWPPLARLLRTHPQLLVAQPLVEPSLAPRWRAGRCVSLPVSLRAYVLLGRGEPYVLPGGLTRQATNARATLPYEGVKDTWVLATDTEAAPAAEVVEIDIPPGRLPLSSRVAEGLYWLGRYLERAENTARMLTLLENVRGDELTRADQQSWWPLWQAVAKSIGKAVKAGQRPTPAELQELHRSLVLDEREPASLVTCLRAARFNAESLREYISPEFWQVLNVLVLELDQRAAPARRRAAPVAETGRFVAAEIARLDGTAERTLLHDAGWQFLVIGELIERAQATAVILDSFLPRAFGRPRPRGDDGDLTALLRVLCSLDAYRREYRSRAYPDRVARLLWQSTLSPNAVAFTVHRIEQALGSLAAIAGEPRLRPLLDHTTATRDRLGQLAIPHPSAHSESQGHTRDTVARFERDTAHLRRDLSQLHVLLEDIFFSHQDSHPLGEQLPLTLPEKA